MKIKELIERLQKFDPELDIMIKDSFNGGGNPREINSGPTLRKISAQNADETADCEGRVDEPIVTIGFGMY